MSEFVSRADRLQAAHDRHAYYPSYPPSDLDLIRMAIPDLLAVVRAAQKHTEDCCRTDLGWQQQMRSHNDLAEALAAFEEGG